MRKSEANGMNESVRLAKGFDRISGIYPLLSFLVFGRQLTKAASCWLKEIPDGSKIVITGGGNGHILIDLFQTCNPSSVIYIELSSGMINSAKGKAKKLSEENQKKIIWVNEDARIYSQTEKYDVWITPFFLDIFFGKELEQLCEKYIEQLNEDGIILLIDFCEPVKSNAGFFMKLLHKIMYRFFRWTCRISAGKLESPEPYFEKSQLKKIKGQLFYFKGIESSAWKKAV